MYKRQALHDQKKEAFETYMDELSRTLKFSEGREAYNAVLTELDGYWELDARILELATSDDADGYLEAQELDTTDLTAQYEQIYAEFVELMNLCVQKGDRAEADLRAMERNMPVSYTHLDVYKRQSVIYTCQDGKIRFPTEP